MVKIFDVVKEKYWLDEDGELFLYESEEKAKEILRKEGYKEAFIETSIEFHLHAIIDNDGYDLK